MNIFQRFRRKPQTEDTPENLNEIALGIHKGTIFCDGQCRSQDEVRMCWPILMMMDEALTERVAERISDGGMIYSYMNDAAPLACNGLPIFFSFRTLTGPENNIVADTIEKLRKAEKKAIA